jgi:hypothetical protein
LAGLCAVTAAAIGRTALAQPQGFATLSGPAAIQVFQPLLMSNPNEPFGPDDEIKFGVRSDFSTWLAVATAHAFRASHRASHDVREPDVWEPEAWKEVEGCLIYDAVSIPAQQCNNGHELCLGRAGRMYGEWEEGATYLLVFDKGSVPLSVSELHKLYEPEKHHQFIGIKKGDMGAYFEHAVRISIASANREQPERLDVHQQGGRAAEARLGELQEELKSESWTKNRCFEVQYVQKDDMKIAYLRPCDKNDS